MGGMSGIEMGVIQGSVKSDLKGPESEERQTGKILHEGGLLEHKVMCQDQTMRTGEHRRGLGSHFD